MANRPEQGLSPQQLQQVRDLADGLRYGTVTLVFQDGVLVQIEKNEKIRITKDAK